jgi:hypothetical protein
MAAMVRIDEVTDRALVELTAQTGDSKAALVARAVRELNDRMFWETFQAAATALRDDPEAWAAYQAERAAWDVTLRDGIEDE